MTYAALFVFLIRVLFVGTVMSIAWLIYFVAEAHFFTEMPFLVSGFYLSVFLLFRFHSGHMLPNWVQRLQISRNRGPIAVGFLLLLEIAVLAWYYPNPVLFVFSGDLFRHKGFMIGGALDQSSLLKYFFLFFVFSIIFIWPTILLARWIGNWSDLRVRSVVVVLGCVLVIHPLSILTIASVHLWRYISAMGWTPMRAWGVVVALAGFSGTIGLLFWISRGFALRQRRNKV